MSEFQRGSSVLEIQEKVVLEYEWDFLIPPKSRVQQNIAAVAANGFSFTDLKFSTGFLSNVEHHWGVSFYTNQINVYISLPCRSSSTAFSITRSRIQLMSKNEIQSTHELNFKRDEYIHPTSTIMWASFWTNSSGAWTESIDNIRIILSVVKEPVGKCIKTLETKTGPLWTDQSGKDLDASGFLNSPHLSDVKILCGEKSLCAHRFLLACKSSVFASMFQYRMKETEEGCIEIKDISLNIVEEMLRYMYTGTVKNLEENCTELLMAAEKYDLGKLKDKCEAVLVGQVTAINALDMYALAETHRTENLLRKSLEILKSHKRQIVSETETFKKFVNCYPELMFELFKI